MKVVYTGRNASFTARERVRVQRKVDKVQRILTRKGGLEAHVTLSRQRHLFEAEVTLRAIRHTLVVSGSGFSPFVALNSALDKLEKQAVRNKHKMIDIRRPGRQRDQPSLVVEDSIQRSARRRPPSPARRRPRPRIVPSPGIEAKPMTAEEALLELDGSQRDYVSYRDADTGLVNVLVRRRDGLAELIEGG